GIKSGSRVNHNFNFSGGGETVTYNASVDYYSNEGFLVGKGPTYERYSGRINTTLEKGIFKISPSLYYAHSFEISITIRGDVFSGERPPVMNDFVIAITTMGM